MRNGEDWTKETQRAAEEALRYVFTDKTLLKTAFTHKSYSNAFGGADNERLEFLGDAVLEFLVSEMLYSSNSGDEGDLTEARQRLVSKAALSVSCERAGLLPYLRYSGGEENLKGKTASNLFESAIAAIYLDGGLPPVKEFLRTYLKESAVVNYRNLLNEFVQARAKTLPECDEPRFENGEFVCTMRALGRSAEGRGSSKQLAEMQAAEKLYKYLSKE